jgi:hypothetical protein
MKYQKPKFYILNNCLPNCATGNSATGTPSGTECGNGGGGDSSVPDSCAAVGASNSGGGYATCSTGNVVGAADICETGNSPVATSPGS